MVLLTLTLRRTGLNKSLFSIYSVSLSTDLTVFKVFGVDSMARCLLKVQLQLNVTAIINLEPTEEVHSQLFRFYEGDPTTLIQDGHFS